MRQTSDSIRATLDNNNMYALNSLLVLTLKEESGYSYFYVLAILNSRLNNYIYSNLTQEKGRVFAEVKPKNVRKLYVPKADSNEQKYVVDLVKKIFKSDSNKEILQKEIDRWIYEKYDFSEDEITIIEEEK